MVSIHTYISLLCLLRGSRQKKQKGNKYQTLVAMSILSTQILDSKHHSSVKGNRAHWRNVDSMVEHLMVPESKKVLKKHKTMCVCQKDPRALNGPS